LISADALAERRFLSISPLNEGRPCIRSEERAQLRPALRSGAKPAWRMFTNGLAIEMSGS